MGIRYQKRLKLSKHLGLNLSKSGVSASFRSKYGSISPKGFSIKTGIPGLTFRGRKTENAAILIVFVGLVLIVWNLLSFSFWLFREIRNFILRKKLEKLEMEEKIQTELMQQNTQNNALIQND